VLFPIICILCMDFLFLLVLWADASCGIRKQYSRRIGYTHQRKLGRSHRGCFCTGVHRVLHKLSMVTRPLVDLDLHFHPLVDDLHLLLETPMTTHKKSGGWTRPTLTSECNPYYPQQKLVRIKKDEDEVLQ